MLDSRIATDFVESYNLILQNKKEEGFLALTDADVQRGATFIMAIVNEDEPSIARFMKSTILEMKEGSPLGGSGNEKALKWSRQMYFFTLLRSLAENFSENREGFALPEASVKVMRYEASELCDPIVEGTLSRLIGSISEFVEKGELVPRGEVFVR